MGQGDNENILNPPTRHLERVFGDGSVILDGVRYPVFLNRVAKSPVISSVTTSGAGWTELISSQTKIVKWRISELIGRVIHYAYQDNPGSNFSVAFGWEAQNTGPSAIFIRRPENEDITVKLELWTFD